MQIMVNTDKILFVQCIGSCFGSVNAIIGLTSERPDIDYSEDGGYFHVRAVDTNNEQAQLILQSLLISLQTIEEEYNEYIKLNLK